MEFDRQSMSKRKQIISASSRNIAKFEMRGKMEDKHP